MALRLEATEVGGRGSWLWRLYDPTEGLLASHQVELDPNRWEMQALVDLPAGVARRLGAGNRLAVEAAVAAEIGQFTAREVLGPVARRLATLAPVEVLVEVPADQSWLLGLPLAIATNGETLAGQIVTFAGTLKGQQRTQKTPIGDRLRVLAVYSVPAGQPLLDLRRERKGLAQLAEYLTGGTRGSIAAIDLRILQYGATARRLQESLSEGEGWDIVHFSGHGTAGHLVLEDGTGKPEVVDTGDLVKWLRVARDRLKLVSLSACSSAAFTVAETLHHLGIPTPDTGSEAELQPASLGLALDIAGTAQCTVVAMRYPVVDDFAIGFALSMFKGMWETGLGAARAVGRAVQETAPGPPTAAAPALSAYTPAIFGPDAIDLALTPPTAVTAGPVDTRMAGFDEPEPARFVGRNPVMTRANAALARDSGQSGVVFQGAAGLGKTACALELAFGQQHNFATLIWAKAPPETGGDAQPIAATLVGLASRFDRALGTVLAGRISDPMALETLHEAMRLRAVLVVIDNAESLITTGGGWLDPRWEALIGALTGHGGLGRLVLTTSRPHNPIPGMIVEVVQPLDREEAILLARQLPNLGRLLDDRPRATRDSDRRLARTILEAAGGHPGLLELADARAATPSTLDSMLTQAQRIWSDAGVDPARYLSTAATDLSVTHDASPDDRAAGYCELLRAWTLEPVSEPGPPLPVEPIPDPDPLPKDGSCTVVNQWTLDPNEAMRKQDRRSSVPTPSAKRPPALTETGKTGEGFVLPAARHVVHVGAPVGSAWSQIVRGERSWVVVAGNEGVVTKQSWMWAGTNASRQADTTLAVAPDGRATAQLAYGIIYVAWIDRFVGRLLPWPGPVDIGDDARNGRLLAMGMSGRSRVRCVISTENGTFLVRLESSGATSREMLVPEPSRAAALVRAKVWTVAPDGSVRGSGPRLALAALATTTALDIAQSAGAVVVAAVGKTNEDTPGLVFGVLGGPMSTVTLAAASDHVVVVRQLDPGRPPNAVLTTEASTVTSRSVNTNGDQ